MNVQLDSPVGIEIVGTFILMLPVIQIAATIKQVLGLVMTEAIACQAGDAQKGKAIVIVIMTVHLDLPVGITIVGTFILMLPVIQIAATISQVLGLVMTEAIASQAGDAQRVKEIVIVTMTVQVDLRVEKTIVEISIPTLPLVWTAVYAKSI